jgi:hypothetical protein
MNNAASANAFREASGTELCVYYCFFLLNITVITCRVHFRCMARRYSHRMVELQPPSKPQLEIEYVFHRLHYW